MGYKVLPHFLATKHAIINVQNTDGRCFAYAILSALHNQDVGKNPHSPCKYADKIHYPVALDDIEAIEDMLFLRITVFTFRDNQLRIPEPVSLCEKAYSREVDILY